MSLGHFAVAAECLAAVVAQRPLAAHRRLLAEALLGAGQPGQAVVHAVRAAEQTPRDGAALVTLGRALAATGEATAAISALELAIIAEDSPQARMELAWLIAADRANAAASQPGGQSD